MGVRIDIYHTPNDLDIKLKTEKKQYIFLNYIIPTKIVGTYIFNIL